MVYSKLIGAGHFLPENIISNEKLATMMPTSAEWIEERTGIKERRFYTPGKDTVSNMGTCAALMACAHAGIDVQEIDLIVFATITSDYYFPGSGVLMQRELGLPGIPAIDIKMQCSGFIYALSVADNFIKSGQYKTALVVGGEIQSNAMELSERGRSISVIFADGAGAVVLKATENKDHRILSCHLHSDGTHAEELFMQHPGSVKTPRLTSAMLEDGSMLPYMNGPLVFKNAVVRFMEVIQEALTHNNLNKDEIDLLIPHQANLRISKYIQEQLQFSDDKVYNNIQRCGNTTAGSIPIALSEAWHAGKLKEGNLLCLAAFGSGFTWASSLIRI